MMRLDRLAAFVATVSDNGTSLLADRAAARWGIEPGAASYVRTSASCVFAVPDGFLRMIAAADADLDHADARLRVAADLAVAGAPVAAPRPSREDRWIERVENPVLGPVLATVVAAVPGADRELDDITPGDVTAWGGTVAAFHAAGGTVSLDGLPLWTDTVRAAVPAGHAELAAVVDDVVRECGQRLGPPRTCLHGDPQPDNVGWGGPRPMFFDLDDMSVGWPVVDLAFAVRDAAPLAALDLPVLTLPMGQALVAAYGAVDDAELAAAALVQRLSAAATYGRLHAALAGPEIPDAPPWAGALRDRVAAVATDLRVALLGAG